MQMMEEAIISSMDAIMPLFLVFLFFLYLVLSKHLYSP